MVMMVVVTTKMNLVNMSVETLVPAAAKGAHLLLVKVGGFVVEFCLGPASKKKKEENKSKE